MTESKRGTKTKHPKLNFATVLLKEQESIFNETCQGAMKIGSHDENHISDRCDTSTLLKGTTNKSFVRVARLEYNVNTCFFFLYLVERGFKRKNNTKNVILKFWIVLSKDRGSIFNTTCHNAKTHGGVHNTCHDAFRESSA